MNPFLEKFTSYDNLHNAFIKLSTSSNALEKEIRAYFLNLEENLIQLQNKIIWDLLDNISEIERQILLITLDCIIMGKC